MYSETEYMDGLLMGKGVGYDETGLFLIRILDEKHTPLRRPGAKARVFLIKVIQAALGGINPLNAGKKRDEAMELLKKFFPDMEILETRFRRYKREFDRQEKENAALAKKAAAGEKEGFTKRLETAQLQADYYNLRRFVDSLPEEIRQQAKAVQKSKGYQR